MLATVTVPGGWWRDGARRRQASLRPVTGHDEESVFAGRELPPLRRADALLARCVAGLDGHGAVRPEDLQALAMGDREALLLHLRRATLGDRADCVVACPHPACGERMDVALRVGDLLHPGYADEAWRPRLEADVEAGGTRYRVAFRPPTAADVGRRLGLAAQDPEAAGLGLVADCILAVEPDPAPAAGTAGAAGPGAPLPAAVLHGVSEAMLRADPQAEARLDLACTGCGRPIATVLDAASFFLDELAGRNAEFHADVHALASAYHWSLPDILGLTPRQRQAYAAALRPRDVALA